VDQLAFADDPDYEVEKIPGSIPTKPVEPVSETCDCSGRSKGFHQHPEFLEQVNSVYSFEFFVCGECNRPTVMYLAAMMERVE